MKNDKGLLFVAMVSGLLVGCGGGGGSSGGSSGTSVSLSFVKAEVLDSTTSGLCRVFERTYDSQTKQMNVLTIKPIEDALDDSMSIVMSDQTGVVLTDSQRFVSNGSVSFSIEEIPEGGYITIREQLGFDVYLTSYSRDFLETHSADVSSIMLTTMAPIANLTCMIGSNATLVEKDNIEYTNSLDIPASDTATLRYFFTSSLQTVDLNNPNSGVGEFVALNTDTTMITQYRGNDNASLFQYGFDDWTPNEMRYTGESSTFNRVSSAEFGAVDINVSYRDQSFLMAAISSSSSTFRHPTVQEGSESWFAVTSGNALTGNSTWQATLNIPIDATWQFDIDESTVFNLSTLSTTTTPIYSNNAQGSLEIDLTNGISINSGDYGIQRIATRPQNNSIDTKLHVVYSLVNEVITLPQIESISASDLSASESKQDFWFSSNGQNLDVRYVLDSFDATALNGVFVDAHGLIITESEREQATTESVNIKSLHLSN